MHIFDKNGWQKNKRQKYTQSLDINSNVVVDVMKIEERKSIPINKIKQ